MSFNRYLLVFFFIFLTFFGLSQPCNLFQNADFETYTVCPVQHNTVNDVYQATEWHSAVSSAQCHNSADYFHIQCGYTYGATQPFPSGEGIVGLVLSNFFAVGNTLCGFNDENYKEYIGQTVDLCANQKYEFQFWASKKSGIPTLPICIYGGNDSNFPIDPDAMNCPTNFDLLACSDVIEGTAWQLYTASFTPTEDYQSIIIGADCNIAGTNTFDFAFLDDVQLFIKDTLIISSDSFNVCENFAEIQVLTNQTCYDAYALQFSIGSDTMLSLIDDSQGSISFLTQDSAIDVAFHHFQHTSLNCTYPLNSSTTLYPITTTSTASTLKYPEICVSDTVFPISKDTFSGTFSLLKPNENIVLNSTTGSITALEEDENFTVQFISQSTCLDTLLLDLNSQQCNKTSCNVYVPSAFSVNQDGLNDVFQPVVNLDCKLEYIDIQIFNRWGQQVYQNKNTFDALVWNPLLNQPKALQGVYYYAMNYKFKQQTMQFKTGKILLIQ